jgi:hypothetical protein
MASEWEKMGGAHGEAKALSKRAREEKDFLSSQSLGKFAVPFRSLASLFH